MLDVEKLLVLREVAAEGSMARAARTLGYTRSAISQQMSALERSAGAALLLRTTNRVSLTSVGQRLVEHTERILVELRAAEATLHQDGSEVAGRIRVGVTFREGGPPIMGSALTGIRQRYPRLDITLATASAETASDDVKHGRLDVVILSQFGAAPTPSEPGVRQWVLGHDELRLCVPADHRLADEVRCSASDLRDEAWVMNPNSPLGRLTIGVCAATGFRPTIAGSVDDIATALGLVSFGWGVTIAPDLTPFNPEAAIRRIPLDGVEAFRYSVLIVREGEQHSPEIAVVVEAVRAASTQFKFLADR